MKDSKTFDSTLKIKSKTLLVYCPSCPWPGRTAAWQRQEQLLKKQPISHPVQPDKLTASPCPPAPGQGLGQVQGGQVYCQPCRDRLQQQASGCRSGLQQPGLAADENIFLNIDIKYHPTGAGIQYAPSTVQSPATAAPTCCP